MLHDPEWLALDRLLASVWQEWLDGLCACGEPVSSHAGKTHEDYGAAYLSCPALEALEREQAKRAKGSKPAKVGQPDSSRWRLWFTKPIDVLRAMAERG